MTSSSSRATYRGSVLVLDDEENMGKIMTKVLNLEGYYVTSFSDPREALEFLENHSIDVVLSDIRMPGMTGREVLERIREMGIGCEVIMMTAYGTIEGAIQCVKLGAFDYITKPFKSEELLLTVLKAFEHKRLKDMNSALTEKFNLGDSPPATRTLVGESPAMAKVRGLLERVGPTESPVLVTGESGTGKELAARAIHQLSRRRKGRFVAINCASIPESLMESELFGHERGAFTGATQTKVGLIELADGGTLFLDEIGELPMTLQAKMLRVLQEREIQRLGGVASIPVDIRVVAATNRDLQRMIHERLFREDLFYRLNVIAIEMPALRERREDIVPLAEHFLAIKRERHHRPTMRFSENLQEILTEAPWRGNVRELENLVERLVIFADTDVLTSDLLPEEIGRPRRISSSSEVVTKLALSAQAMVEEVPDFKSARDSFEREYLEALLRTHSGNVSDAARHAGMSRRNLYEKIEKLGIPLGDIKDDPEGMKGS